MARLYLFIGFMLATCLLSAQTVWTTATDSMTNSQNDTLECPLSLHNKDYATIRVTVDAVSGTAEGTLYLDGSIDGEAWYPLIFGASDGTNYADVTSYEIGATANPFIIYPPTGYFVLDATYSIISGTQPFRYLRARVVQTGTGVSIYSFKALFK